MRLPSIVEAMEFLPIRETSRPARTPEQEKPSPRVTKDVILSPAPWRRRTK